MRRYLLFIFFIVCNVAFGQSLVKKAQNSFDDAQQYVRQNIFDEAIKHLNAAVKADPKFQQAYGQLGDIYKRLKNTQKAKEYYRLAVNAAPVENASVYFLLGETELQTGDYLQAKQSFETL